MRYYIFPLRAAGFIHFVVSVWQRLNSGVRELILLKIKLMKRFSLLLFALSALVLPSFVSAQDPHVHTRYVKDSKTTVVETDLMYIVNTPQQFVQLGFVTRYPNERLEKPPKKVDLVLWSFSREAMYRGNQGPTLKVNLDGETWSINPQAYIVYKGETKNGQDIFWSEKRPDLGQPSVLPKTAQVKAQGDINGLYMEQIFFEFKPDQLQKIAQAKKVEMQLGVTKLVFANEYLSTIRDFANHLVPGAQPTNAQQAVPTPTPRKPGDPIDVGVVNGKALSLSKPAYPSLARSAGASGAVNVLVTIDETGKVVAARAISGHPLLREVSEAAAKASRFQPPTINGQPVKVTGIIIFNFAP